MIVMNCLGNLIASLSIGLGVTYGAIDQGLICEVNNY